MSKTITLQTRKYESEGNLSWEYNPLHNIIDENTTSHDGMHALEDFDVSTSDLNLDMDHPVEVEVQPSYDGSVNLILNDGHDVPRIINSAFTVQEDWKYKRVVRNQQKQTNYYPKDQVDETTRLFRTTNTFLHVDLLDIEDGGELKGGNYIFYFKYGDEDFNETDWIGESGVVSIFHGFADNLANVRGTLMHEKTNHQVTLHLTNLDTAFSKLYVYVQRAYSDLNGVTMKEYYKLSKPYDIRESNMYLTITGYEQTSSVSQDVFNIQYNVYDSVATSTQVQNRLFFGNVQEIVPKHTELSNCALNIEVGCCISQDLGYVSTEYSNAKISSREYYNPEHIYSCLGYWPEELYRLGVVFVYNNDTLSDAYNLKGCCFKSTTSTNHIPGEDKTKLKNYDLTQTFINGDSRYNTKGVFQMPDYKALGTGSVTSVGFKMKIPEFVITELRKLKIKGLFFVRQPRIPIALAQAYSIGISKCAHIPVLSKIVEDKEGKEKASYIAETILKGTNLCRNIKWSYDNKNHSEEWEADCCALLCQDANLNKSLQSMFDGTSFVLKPYAKYNTTNSSDYRNYSLSLSNTDSIKAADPIAVKLAYVAPQTASRVLEGAYFSSKSGSESELVTLRNLKWDEKTTGTRPIDDNTIRGNFTGYLGVLSGNLKENTMYTICTQSYIGTNPDKRKTQIELRAQDNTPFTSISQRVDIRGDVKEMEVFGGDCFTCTTSTKMCYNFLDYNTPLNDKIVKSDIRTQEEKDGKVEKWNDYNNWKVADRNISDWNAVDIGHYATYKCMSNFNLGLRCIDDQRTDERALFGDTRSFYPYSHHTYGVSFKIPESDLMNSGNSSVLGERNFFVPDRVPFVKEFFDNRIAFSNIQSVDSFQNNYRVFSSLSYTDVERQYGAIVKLLPLGANLFCVFEHGCGLVPINEKALLSTTTGQSIHLYGSDVVQSQVTVISPDYGSTWEESIIETPNGIYGVDTFAKKIWRYSAEGFAIISDMLVQRFLNDNINLTEYDLDEIVACKNVKSHFNNYKGDVMFTFYNGSKEWNLCYNERIQKWTTRYTWTPVYSANIYNSFVSTDKRRSEYYGKVDLLRSKDRPLYLDCAAQLNYNSVNRMYEAEYIAFMPNKQYASETVSGDEKTVVTPFWNPNVRGVDIYHGDSVTSFIIPDKETVYSQNDGSLDIKTCKWDIATIKKQFVVNNWVHWECPGYGIIGRISKNTTSTGLEEINDLEYLSRESFNWFSDWIIYPISQNTGHFSIHISDVDENSPKYDTSNPIYQVVLNFEYNIFQSIDVFKIQEGKEDSLVEHSQLKNTSGAVTLPLLVNTLSIDSADIRNAIDDKLRIQFYTHGKAGNYSEINYLDKDPNNNILPTKWYGKQEPFEFEFVVNSVNGYQKIFDNIAIISNNAEPDSIECTIIGDSYDFNKEGIYNEKMFAENEGEYEFENTNNSQNFVVPFNIGNNNNISFTTNISRDHVLNQYTLTACSKLRDIADLKYGRRLGNMNYLEDKWNITLDPIYFKNKQRQLVKNEDDTAVYEIKESGVNTVKLRDKWVKIRIKYKGDKLAVISAIQSMFTISFA